ncbi:unnamed protein product [Dicrocoelium dendriticum]|nr:unnamed protein product [Dicrocoelium dendriticum]
MVYTIYLQALDGNIVDVLPKIRSNSVIKVFADIGKSSQNHGAYKSIVKLSGLCGALALLLSIYGAHALTKSSEKHKRIFQLGAHYQLISAIVLLGVPWVDHPYVVTALLTAGTVMFSGSCYHMALTGKGKLFKLSSVGAITLLLAWFSILL